MLDTIYSKTKPHYLIVLIAVAYIFSFAIRMIWIYQFNGNADMYWNDQLMINTNDGYFFASMAQKILEDLHQFNPRVMNGWSYAVVALTVLVSKVTPFSLETIILYMPAVVSSLVVIPIILIGRLYNNLSLGFFAALMASIAWSYYNRTMVGYFDTDMFSAMAPMFILYFLLATVEREEKIYSLLSALSILVYPFLYDQGLSLVYAMGLFYMVYMLVFHRQEEFTYQSIILISISLMGIDWYVKLALILIGFFLFKKYKFEYKYLVVVSALSVILFLISGNVFALIYGKMAGYIIRGTQESGLHFYQVAQTVREAGRIPFSVMADRISGSTVGVLLAFIGYGMLVWKHKSFILALPLIGIGIFSLWGGLRFTVYAVPVAALGAVFCIYFLTSYIKDSMPRTIVMILAVAALIYPNITHIIDYKVPTVFSKNEVEVLDKLKHIGSGKDYVITWWDYGYPIWFYTGKNTLIDGGKHHNDNYIVSKILSTSSPKEASRLSRIAVETYVDSNYSTVADTLFRNKKEDQVNTELYLENLRYGEVEKLKKTRDVYLYFPLRMLDIFPTVKVFSNLDLDTGKKLATPFFYKTNYMKQSEKGIDLGSGLIFKQKEGLLSISNQEVPVKKVVTAGYQANGKLGIRQNSLHDNGSLIVLILQSYNTVVVMDEEMFNSNYIQMFFLENYDPEFFEPVIGSPWSKVYRVKS
jgi:dolichyl-diphosphooligosaccharide--protein glycosyltransferase/undecaprenyl-diphosphooligosaccharide--protein glycosyltransferase